jgi:CspA family cold shock protein
METNYMTNQIMEGTVKWYDATKGYGFITIDNDKNDIFIHVSALKQAGLATLNPDQKIQFEVTPDANKRDRVTATNIKLL